jgi:hypothetical protein
VNDTDFFNFLRRKKAEWSAKPHAKLTQGEVNEANKIVHPDDIVVVAPVQPTVPSPEAGILANKRGPLAAIVGSLAATSLFFTVPKHEGTRYEAYRDIAGIVTICQGDTTNVRMGLIETPAGCRERLERQLVIHAEGVMACTRTLKQEGRDYQRAAAVSLAY